MSAQWLGWVSSSLLVLTLATQLKRQWSQATAEGVSPWLFVGQGTASCGLLVYSWLGDQTVFVVLNATMMAAALAGLAVWARGRRRDEERERAGESRPPASDAPRGAFAP